MVNRFLRRLMQAGSVEKSSMLTYYSQHKFPPGRAYHSSQARLQKATPHVSGGQQASTLLLQPAPPLSITQPNEASHKVIFQAARGVVPVLVRSMENLQQVCVHSSLHVVLESLLKQLPQTAETNLEKLFFTAQHEEYRYKYFLHGWFGIKNEKHLAWSDVLVELKKLTGPLRFEAGLFTQTKNYLIYKLTLAYAKVEKTTPYLVNVIDLHLQQIHQCTTEEQLRTLVDTAGTLSRQHTLKEMLTRYGDVPPALNNGPLWPSIQAQVIEEHKPSISVGIYMQ